jgi:predicted RNase H-like nuclease (RuvC/YqgF family)
MFGLNLNSAADLLNMKNQLEALTANAVDAANAKKDEEWSSKVNALQAKLDGISADNSTAMANAIEAKTQEFELQVNNLTTENEGLKNQITALQNQISKLENKPDNTGSPNGGDDLSGGKDEGDESLSELRNYYSKKLKNRS